MFLSRFRAPTAALALCTTTLFGGGCNLLEAITGPGSTLVTVFATHHATPDNGVKPSRGEGGDQRVFLNDEGWTVHLVEGVVTTQGVTLHRCDGTSSAVELYFGSLAEDLSGPDLDRKTLGGTEVEAGDYCGLTVHYGPFTAGEDVAPGDMAPSELDGSTVYLYGFAEREGTRVPFEIHTRRTLDVRTTFAGTPDGSVTVTGDEPFPVELTVAKTYDRFFDGVDFSALDEAELSEQVAAILELETETLVTR